MDWDNVIYFKSKEFDSPDKPGSGARMDPDFVRELDSLRHRLGFPLVINSGYRTTDHNTSVGGKADSAHTKGLAVDIKCHDSRTRFRIVVEAAFMGFTRIGVAKTFIHLDADDTKPRSVMWLY